MRKKIWKNKEEFREFCKQKSRNNVKISHFAGDKKINAKLQDLFKKNKIRNILLFVPLENEVDIFCFFRTLRGKYKIFVPFMEGVSFKMVKFRLPLIRGRFGIKEPKNSFAKVPRIDVAIVPVLGVDGAMKRIGFGKGMYDRFFASLSYMPKVVFVQPNECMTTQILCQSHDIQAELYITPKNTIQRGKNDTRIQPSSSRCTDRWDSRFFCSKETRRRKLRSLHSSSESKSKGY